MSCNSDYGFFIISYMELSKYNKHEPGKSKVIFFVEKAFVTEEPKSNVNQNKSLK